MIPLIDLHTHILPEIDDGSRSVEMSLKLLQMEQKQKAGTVVLTPHFYPWRDQPDHFFEKREHAWARLQAELPQETPRLHRGAEFAWFDGISHTREVLDFRITGTDLLLVEMPFVKWTNHTVDEVLRLNEIPHLQVVLAHVDRYFKLSSKELLERLMDEGVIFQFNAEAFLSWNTRRKVMKLIREMDGFFLGSDCHNLTSRPPRIGEAMKVLQEKGGREAVHKLRETEDYFFGEAIDNG